MHKTKSYLSFIIGQEVYGVELCHVRNIIDYTGVTKVPGMPGFFLGTINHDGKVLPVVDIRKKFGITETGFTKNTCILVTEVSVNNSKAFVGALVDKVSEVLRINVDHIFELPKIGNIKTHNYISGIYHDDEQLIMILNLKEVVAVQGAMNLESIEQEV